jgi:hypothetical protein
MVFFLNKAVKVLSSWYEELKVANSAFHNFGWLHRASSRSRSSTLSLRIAGFAFALKN